MMVLASSRLIAIDDALGGAFGDRLSQHHFDADARQRTLRIGRQIVGKTRQHAGSGLDQDDARLVGVDVAEVGRQGVLREFGDGAGKFDAGRAGADNDKGQQRRPPFRIALAFGAFEGHQDTAPERGGVLQCFQAGRERLPFVMTEIRVTGAGGENERIVGQCVAVIEQHPFAILVHAGHRGEQGRHFRAMAQQIADRPGDLRCRQRRGGDLIQERLEQMMVAPVNHRDADRRARQAKRRFQPAEAGADDYHAMRL